MDLDGGKVESGSHNGTAEGFINLPIIADWTNLLDKNAVIYTNEGNYDLRETVNEPRVFGIRLRMRFGGKGGEE